MSYYDVAKSLLELDFEKIVNWVDYVWNFIKDPVNSSNRLYTWFKDTLESIYTKLLSLTWYEQAKWWSYVWTNLSLSVADPAGKVLSLAWAWFFVKVWKYVNNRLLNFVKDDSKLIWKNWPNISSKTISQFSWGWRIDIENPNPWQRAGQLHYQKIWDNNKYYFNFSDLKFHIWSSGWTPANNNIQSLLDDDEVIKAIVKWKKYLDGK